MNSVMKILKTFHIKIGNVTEDFYMKGLLRFWLIKSLSRGI